MSNLVLLAAEHCCMSIICVISILQSLTNGTKVWCLTSLTLVLLGLQASSTRRRLLQNNQNSVYLVKATTTADSTAVTNTVQSSTFQTTIQSAVKDLGITVQNIGELRCCCSYQRPAAVKLQC